MGYFPAAVDEKVYNRQIFKVKQIDNAVSLIIGLFGMHTFLVGGTE